MNGDKDMKLTKSKLKEMIKAELNESSLYRRASGLVKTRDLYEFVKMGKSMKSELEKDGMGDRQVQEFLQELIKKRIL
jgi:hypothetical protein